MRLLLKRKSKYDSVSEILNNDATLKMSCVNAAHFLLLFEVCLSYNESWFKFHPNLILGGIYSCNGVELQW